MRITRIVSPVSSQNQTTSAFSSNSFLTVGYGAIIPMESATLLEFALWAGRQLICTD
jgi:hypothetical protein